MQKAFSLLADFFTVLLLREKQKKPFVSPTFFCTRYFSKTKRKPAKKIEINVFLSIGSSHAKN